MWPKLLGEIESLLPTAFVAFIFGVIKAAMAPEPNSIKRAIATVLISVPVGTLAGMLARESGLQIYSAYTVCSLCSLLAHDIVTGIMKNKTFLFDLAKRALENIVDKQTK